MGHFFYHWVWMDLWGPVWPNLVASLVVYVFVFLKMRALADLHKEITSLQVRHHEEHMSILREIKDANE